MFCTVTENDQKEIHTTSILRENQFFDREADCCRVYSEDALTRMEGQLLRCGISFSVREEHTNPLIRLFGARERGIVIRVNERDMEDAMYIAEGVRGVEVIGVLPEEDWNPVQAKKRREEERIESARFQADWKAEEDDEEEYRRKRRA